jgi:phosphoribosylanthranilate isomerase
MDPTGTPRVKVCCIMNVNEARMAIRHGASALGLVSEMPSGPGPISEDTIAAIVATIPPGISSFLLTSKTDPDEIIAQQRRTRANTLQLVDSVDTGCYERLRAMLPGIAIVQVVHVSSSESIDEALAIERFVDALLLDSGNPRLPIKELGGTGRVHDWTISRIIRERAKIPVFLAGGLTPDNVGEAIARVGPFGLDLCSGIRRNGALDEALLSSFMRSAGGSRMSHPGGVTKTPPEAAW